MYALKRIGLACVLAVAAGATVAITFKINAVRPGNFSFATPSAFVPLNAAGATTLVFNQGGATPRVLTYSAECTVDAPAGNNFAWLDIDVYVNGVAVPPTAGTADAFCSADGVAGFGGYTRPSITIAINPVAGANSVRILARLNAGATGGWLGDSALVVY